MKFIISMTITLMLSILTAPHSARADQLQSLNGMTAGCGGYVQPVFPKYADESYKGTCWVADVKKDQFTDKASCVVYPAGTSYDAYPFIVFQKHGVYMTVSGGDRYPGTPITIRVDKHKAVSGGKSFSRSAAQKLLQEMSNGSVIMARFSDWPYNTYKVGRMDAKGIGEAMQYCRSRVK